MAGARAAQNLAENVRRAASRPPPPPPAPAPPRPQPQATAADLRYQEFLRRAAALPPPEGGATRLYRVGETATNFVPPKVIKQWGQEVPYEQWRASLREAQENGPTPHGANGRWATDAPNELDFYIRDNDLDTPIYYFDVPNAQQYNVSRTPYAKNSRNHAREFVLPDDRLRAGTRLMSLAALLLAPAQEDQ